MNLQKHRTDVLILGSGGAGLLAALHAKQAAPDLDVTVAVKGLMGKCGCTRMVQGGYNVALAPGDSLERHFMDTIVGGKWLPRQDLAWRLCEGAIERIAELPWVKVSEWGLVVLLSVHLTFGLRILALEFLPWTSARKSWVGWGAGFAAAAGLLFIVAVR